jgi:glycine/serine hydroxymethyltransferase
MVESEAENRENKKKALAAVLAEKRAELERADRYYQSLQQIEAEQNTLIAKLSSSES